MVAAQSKASKKLGTALNELKVIGGSDTSKALIGYKGEEKPEWITQVRFNVML